MDDATTTHPTTSATAEPTALPVLDEPRALAGDDLLDEELLVEEISIDGMCGVY